MTRNKVHPLLVQRWVQVYMAKYRKDPKEAAAWFNRMDDDYKPLLMAALKRR